jgi:hypothetical protein
VIKTHTPPWYWRSWESYFNATGRTWCRYRTGETSYVLLRFDFGLRTRWNLLDTDRVAAVETVSLGDLRAILPPDTFETIKRMHLSPAPDQTVYNPIALVRAVNHLWGLGKQEALRRLGLYLDLARNRERAWRYDINPARIPLIMRLLCVSREPAVRIPYMGGYLPSGVRAFGRDEQALYPFVLAGDIPFFVASAGRGDREPYYAIARELKSCADACDLRGGPLTPSVNPVAAADELVRIAREAYAEDEQDDLGAEFLFELRRQAVSCLVASGLATEELSYDTYSPTRSDGPDEPEEAERLWQHYSASVRRRRTTWNAETQKLEWRE